LIYVTENLRYLPIIKRWNSLFFGVKKILTHKDKLIDAFEELKLKNIKMSEWKFIEEYCLVMEPLAMALDKLQGEKSSVERLLSSGIQVLTSRRNRLNDITFEMLLCCRCLNLKV